MVTHHTTLFAPPMRLTTVSVTVSSLLQLIPIPKLYLPPLVQRLLYWIEYRTSTSISHLTNLHTRFPILHSTRYFWLHMCIPPIVDSNRVSLRLEHTRIYVKPSFDYNQSNSYHGSTPGAETVPKISKQGRLGTVTNEIGKEKRRELWKTGRESLRRSFE